MQIRCAPLSKIESEARLRAASRGMGERKTGNSKSGNSLMYFEVF